MMKLLANYALKSRDPFFIEEASVKKMLDELTLNDPTLADVIFEVDGVEMDLEQGDFSEEEDFEVTRKKDVEVLLENPNVQKKLRGLIITESILKTVVRELIRKNLKNTNEAVMESMSSAAKLQALFMRSKLIMESHTTQSVYRHQRHNHTMIEDNLPKGLIEAGASFDMGATKESPEEAIELKSSSEEDIEEYELDSEEAAGQIFRDLFGKMPSAFNQDIEYTLK
mmetsp:Transcript_18757/g.28812  ORF Transcript_18757/g.28812 Transcript_18757/m.28812 type:complete len:226 (-) Transcript_18757:3252-3929(-)